MHPSGPLLTLAALGVLACPGTAAPQATFTHVQGTVEEFTGASSDGVWCASGSGAPNEAWIWSAGTGAIAIATSGNSNRVDVSADGQTIGGTWHKAAGGTEAALIQGGVTTFLGGLGGEVSGSVSTFAAMNDDATVVVGNAHLPSGALHAFRWTPGGGMQDLGVLAPGHDSVAHGLSQDGAIVVGSEGGLVHRPVYWNGSTCVLIADAPGEAWGTNSDGSVIVGVLEGELFRWDALNGAVQLGTLPDSSFPDQARGVSVSDDGDTIVGHDGGPFLGSPFRAFVWRPGAGMVRLDELLPALGASGTQGLDLSFAYNVSADGRTISGGTGEFPLPNDGFVATLPEVAETYCTAKINSAGCTPAIGFAGTPSASSGAGFSVTASQILAQFAGVLIYSKDGPDAVPFQGGTLCLSGAILRTPGVFSGGTTGCTGSLSMDFNAWVATGIDPLLVGGTTVWAQWWSRDQGFPPPNNSNLTDALEFTLWP